MVQKSFKQRYCRALQLVVSTLSLIPPINRPISLIFEINNSKQRFKAILFQHSHRRCSVPYFFQIENPTSGSFSPPSSDYQFSDLGTTRHGMDYKNVRSIVATIP